ncbi:FMN-binding protein [Microlunatus endophyticus]|uniref:FMN-binding protein n=1 Tax=Microlunatus endophyticus TaxID=1716077 RepID=A0A917S4G7_9ACTN|nr:FMN-binding protein [Microlunatus endophyticus]GGL56382.1 FMN-binding protein [Microlunatus endophyticus]
MKKIAIWIASTVTVVVLLFGYHTSTNKTSALGSTTDQSPGTTVGQSGQSSSTPSSAPSTSPPKTGTGGSKSYTGDVAQTERGPVQVKITVKHKKITGVSILQVPSEDPMDVRINDYAVPILIKETISAQSAQIDMVSGATVTGGGYLESLQSALDRAGI